MVDDQNEHDINSVAGVLKLYFRGLENPLFPKEHFLDFISTISKSHTAKISKAVPAVHRPARERKENHLALGLLMERKACSAAHGSNLSRAAPCMICNKKPVGRGERGPHYVAVCELTTEPFPAVLTVRV